ncbi:MAG TPA: TspO/MBR family protein [Steroidobacteraceae bacterium]|nr:TspO/MBR family protein [Steroidobacteraceae bacterium]
MTRVRFDDRLQGSGNWKARNSVRRHLMGLVGWLLVAFAGAAIGAVGSLNAASFYGQLMRPGWAPPSGLFGPVWSILYFLMGLSAWLVWRSGGFREDRRALALFISQLVANALWSWIFFAWHQGAGALVEVVILWGLILATIASFRRLNVLAAWLLLPYLLWVTFATALTFSVWRLNPGLL